MQRVLAFLAIGLVLLALPVLVLVGVAAQVGSFLLDSLGIIDVDDDQ